MSRHTHYHWHGPPAPAADTTGAEILAALARIEGRQETMSQALTDKLTELGVDEAKVIALIQADNANTAALTAQNATQADQITALQAANAALQAQQGDDSPAVAQVQALIDAFTPVLTPAAPADPGTGTPPPPSPTP